MNWALVHEIWDLEVLEESMMHFASSMNDFIVPIGRFPVG
jgi:hypothetical protein